MEFCSADHFGVELYFLNCFVIHYCAVALREDALSVATEGLAALREEGQQKSQMVGDDRESEHGRPFETQSEPQST